LIGLLICFFLIVNESIFIDDDLAKTEVSSDFHLQPKSELGLTHEDLVILTNKIKKYLEHRKVY
jgi:hypothetical protein